jgi:DNA invertase Pin-like site-specific DNA recombinase
MAASSPQCCHLLQLEIDAVLVTELSQWGRSTKDLVETLDELYDRDVSVLPLNDQSFDLNSANGR